VDSIFSAGRPVGGASECYSNSVTLPAWEKIYRVSRKYAGPTFAAFIWPRWISPGHFYGLPEECVTEKSQ
jgi:hypothetical protein